MAELTQLTEKSLVASCKAGGAITAGAVVVYDTSTAGEVDLPAAAKCDGIAGVALTAAASGDMIAVIKSGIVKCNAGGTIAIGNYVEVGSTAGEVTAIPATEASARTAHALGIATSAGVDEGNVLVEIRMQDKAVAATEASAQCKAGGAITAGAVVVFDTSTAGEVDLPAAAKCDGIAGVALTDAASGDMIAVIKSGIVKCNAGGTIAIGDYVEVGSTAGKVTAIPATEESARTAHALGIATSAGVDEGNVLVEIRMQDKAVAAAAAGAQ